MEMLEEKLLEISVNLEIFTLRNQPPTPIKSQQQAQLPQPQELDEQKTQDKEQELDQQKKPQPVLEQAPEEPELRPKQEPSAQKKQKERKETEEAPQNVRQKLDFQNNDQWLSLLIGEDEKSANVVDLFFYQSF